MYSTVHVCDVQSLNQFLWLILEDNSAGFPTGSWHSAQLLVSIFKVASKFDYTTGNFVENLYERILYFKFFSDTYTCSCVA